MLATAARSQVVFVGEQHDDPNTHRLERAILEGLVRRRPSIILALEMFERDVQPSLDRYLSGQVSEEDFLKDARPWPRYATDYRPLIELARAHRWPVIAGNVPRRYASQVAKAGLSSLQSLPAEERAFVAQRIECPHDEYFKRFSEVMNKHPQAPEKTSDLTPAEAKAALEKREAEARETLERFYQAQCIKDETMAESIAHAYLGQTGTAPLTVHFNGAFHSDFGLGTAARTKSLLPKAAIKIITIIPVDDLDNLDPGEYRKRGDFLVFTLKPFKSMANSTGK